MTLVFRTAAGALLQTQVNRADVIATISAARSAWGWMGGLEGFKDILSHIHGSLAGTNVPKLAQNLKLKPTTFHILTTDGSIPCSIENSEETFGGDFRTQVIGLTICALAHECGGNVAVRLFMHCLGPVLFSGAREITEALHAQLNDNLQKILNEGAARGYTELFTKAISNLGVTHGDRQWLRDNLRASETDETFPTEIAMVGGLMKWLTQERREAYLTRSALVANVAICLKTVGYLIDSVKLWNGSGKIPPVVGSGAVILVLGGSVETDSLMLDHAEVIGERYTHHYHYSTVGAMLSNALDNQSDVAPEVFQTCFEGVYSHMESHLDFRWTLAADTSCPLKAVAQWQSIRKEPSPISTRLAAIHFPFCANHIAPCYELMADEESLREVLSSKDAIAGIDLVPPRLAMFRVVTASIVISLWSRLGGKDFKTLRHATTLQLSTSDWLEQACQLLNQKMSSGLDFYDVACGVAVIHAASDPERKTRSLEKIIGWRSGVYAVVPALLLEMAPTKAALGVQCIDYYWANTMVHSDGSIRSATKPGLMQSYYESDAESANENATVQSLSEPHIAPPVMSSADVPLYLNIERPVHYGESDLCLCGRLYGQSIGIVAIHDILETLIRSFEDKPVECPGHTSSAHVFTVKASMWASNRWSRPFSPTHATFVPVKNDRCWALYLAGETAFCKGSVVLDCLDCVVNKAAPMSAIIGYSGTRDTD